MEQNTLTPVTLEQTDDIRTQLNPDVSIDAQVQAGQIIDTDSSSLEDVSADVHEPLSILGHSVAGQPSTFETANHDKLPMRLFALVIGINTYPGLPPERQLTGAVSDAEAVVRYLKDSFIHLNVTYLCEGAATREGIITAFQSLMDNTDIQRDDAILIYYAGHGARTDKPSGPNWDRWVSLDSKVEQLCPSDIGTGPKGELICGIPDRTIAALLNALSEKHGDNITLILDCCHAAGANRKFGNTKARVITDPPPMPANCDDAIWSKMTPSRAASVSVGFLGQDRESHVLLAACSRNELAWELDGRGLFTKALLKVLTEVGSKKLDYATLIRKLEDLSRYLPSATAQTPHCDGVHVNRVLFEKHTAGGDTSFISGQVNDDGNIVLNAGDAQSIWKGAQVEVYASNCPSTETNKALGSTVVSHTLASKSILETSTAFQLPPHFYAKLTQRHPDEKLFVYCREMEKLEAHLNTRIPDLAALGIVCVGKGDSPDVALSFEGEEVIFEKKEHILSRPVRRCIPPDILSTKGLLHILQATARFIYHLNRANLSKRSILPDVIPMDFHKLEEDYDVFFRRIRIPGPNIIANGLATITIKGKEIDGAIEGDEMFGFTIHNNTELLLHPYIFCFDSSDLSIKPWHLAPLGTAGDQHVDTQLLPKSSFPVGYGDSGANPRSFDIPNGLKADITFFKLFVTNKPTDFSFLAQESPFYPAKARASYRKSLQTMQPDIWGCVTATVVQQR